MADNLAVRGELLAPEGIGQKSDWSGTFLVLGGKKGATECGRDTEGVKEIVGDHDGLRVLRFAVAGQVEFGTAPERLIAGDFLKRLRVAGVFLVGTDVVGDGRESTLAVIAGEPHQRSESGNGRGRRRSVLTILNTAIFAPMPRVRITMAISVKARSLRRARKV